MHGSDQQHASRRGFIVATGLAAAAATLPKPVRGGPSTGHTPKPLQDPPDSPDPAGEDPNAITEQTLIEAQKLTGIEFTDDERAQMLNGMSRAGQQYRQRMESLELPNELAPATVFDPTLGAGPPQGSASFKRSATDAGPLPADDRDIAYAPVTSLSRWIEAKQLTSARLTEIYLRRLKEIGPQLECVVTLTQRLAREQAARADREIAAGQYRGPLHGIPWGAKDLLDTAGIKTTWGAKPYQNRVAENDATVVTRLTEAGAVLIAKTTLGAIAYGDIWFGGRTNNPWNLEQGSSGSSAGSASGTAAGLFGFSLGTETLGSIVSPSMRCGVTGLRPTFGRVSRTGAMALCWSLDKIGPICRTVEDCALVLNAISGADAGDPSSVDAALSFDAGASVQGMRVGYSPAWFEGRRASDLDRAGLDAARDAGVELVEIELPDWPYGLLMTILSVEAAAAFEELTISNLDDELVWQSPRAWPNSFRETRFVPAIELMQAQRFRRKVAAMMAEKFADLDAMIGPSFASSMLLITNNTGHPSVTLRNGFEDGQPRGMTVWGRLFGEGAMCRLGMALEERFDVWHRRPEF